MKTTPSFVFVMAAMGLALASPARASIYSQSLSLNGDGGGFSYPLQQWADAFRLSAAATLQKLDWYGDNILNTFPSDVSFRVDLYQDIGGLPATASFASELVTATATDTGPQRTGCRHRRDRRNLQVRRNLADRGQPRRRHDLLAVDPGPDAADGFFRQHFPLGERHVFMARGPAERVLLAGFLAQRLRPASGAGGIRPHPGAGAGTAGCRPARGCSGGPLSNPSGSRTSDTADTASTQPQNLTTAAPYRRRRISAGSC